MNNTKKKNNSKLRYLALILMLCLFSTLLFIPNTAIAIAEDIEYSNVLDDLKSDAEFNESDYPVVENDYSLQVITIAESVNKELFIYVYQPSVSLQATSINVATGYRNKEYTNYKLTYLNNQNTLFKYKVNDFVVSEDVARYYEISSIFRAWDENLDQKPTESQTIEEVSYGVGKQYRITDNSMECTDIELISITDKYVGFVRYLSGTNFWGTDDYVDSHFIAFSTNKTIESLLEADVYFETQSVYYREYGSYWEFGDVMDNYSYMDQLSAVVYESDYSFWFNSSYEWQRIQTVNDFISGENFSTVYQCGVFNVEGMYTMDETAKSYIEDSEWVLRFYENSYIAMPGIYGAAYKWTRVSNVSLLRLKFESSGIVYNLGVIDDKQSGDGMPDNEMKIKVSLRWTHLIGLFFIVLLVLLLIFEPKIIFGLIKGIWWVITSPLEIFEGD